ncbi:hypothetical protein HD806DRAFT_524376 [Xylariaceae sp. AK1471]|nr:hypothetical protein HD806DRAFT_524376 [Xylariaceae sp. AK1471]
MSDDGEDDDSICVWRDGPELPDFYDSDDEPLAGHFRKVEIEPKLKSKQSDGHQKKMKAVQTTEGQMEEKVVQTAERSKPRPAGNGTKASKPAKTTKETQKQNEAESTPPPNIDPKTGKLTKEAFREREIQYALSSTRRNLTRVSQFLLKLEARTGKATKEGIRQTLDATVRDNNYDFATSSDEADHKSEIEEIKHISEGLYSRLYLIDRHWRKIARETRDSSGKSPDIPILSEGDIKEWIKVEINTNHLSNEETCFYTVQDLASNRSFRDWMTYLRKLCEFKDHPSDEAKLVELAWRFLDRNLRGVRPVNPTTVEQFISELEGKKRSGVWKDVLKNPNKQEEDDAEAWRAMRRYWSSRTAPA